MPGFSRFACLAAGVTIALWGGLSGTALAAGNWGGADPSANYPPAPMPAACSDPTSSDCINAAVSYLDSARANLGQPAYSLPSNFDSLAPDDQLLILADLDRLQNGLTPIQGVTAALDQDATVAVQNDTDPQPSAGNYTMWTGNWAGGVTNMPMAYGLWMYDDGPGSGNVACTTANAAGCWGHRHDVLWAFDSSGALALGAAAGLDSSGSSSFAMLAFEGDDTYAPIFTYTWSQAVAAGANGGVSGVSTSPGSGASPRRNPVAVAAVAKLRIGHLRVKGHRVTVSVVTATTKGLSCAVSRHRGKGWRASHFRHCSTVAVFSHLARGRYRLRVRQGQALATRNFRVR